jgi:hypothetical protein
LAGGVGLGALFGVTRDVLRSTVADAPGL